MNVTTPIVLFIYKRTSTTLELFEALKKVRPQKIFIFANGPQNENEIDLCNATRAIFDKIDWTDDVYRDFLPTNIGLANRLVSGINQVFNTVDKAIFLEDDCIPNESFFPFCETMLADYQENHQVMHINGTNLVDSFQLDKQTATNSFFFTKYAFCWGWASWARAWKRFNPHFDTWMKEKENLQEKIHPNNREVWNRIYSYFENGFKESWDLQWTSDILANDGLVITPKNNLISNIGTGAESSYMPKNSSFAHRLTKNIENNNFQPPLQTKVNHEFNQLFEDKMTELMLEFMSKNKELKKANEIVSFLTPIEIKENIQTHEEVKDILNIIPPYTILPLDFFNAMMNKCINKPIIRQGNWVEIGVWKGGGALFFKALMEDLSISKHLYLFDTFGNIPLNELQKEKDKAFVDYFNMNPKNVEQKINSTDNRVIVENLLSKFNYRENTFLIEHDINYLPQNLVPKEIAFLHLDVDFYEATFSALNLFYDSIVPGGIIIIDDYYNVLFNCKEAVDLFIEQKRIKSHYISKFSSYAVQIIKPI